ncbi:hypothetical protein SN04_03249 [Serratia marcescens]|nr:hypothetical protein SN04_03249 [Serratia marcescens]
MGLKIPVSLVRFRVRAPYSEEPAYGGFFAFWGTDSPSNCVRLFGLKASPCGPALKRCSTRRQRRLSESGRPIQKNPPMAGFSLSGVRTLHRTAFDYSAKGLTLRASAKALFNAAPAPVVRVRSPYSEEPAYGGFFAFWDTDSPSNCVRLFDLTASPCAPALKCHRIIRWMCNFALQVHFLKRPAPNPPRVKRAHSYSPFIECFLLSFGDGI